jgi:hypothetical protein
VGLGVAASSTKYPTRFYTKGSKSFFSPIFQLEFNFKRKCTLVRFYLLNPSRGKSLKYLWDQEESKKEWGNWSFDSKLFDGDDSSSSKSHSAEKRPRNQMKGGLPWGLSFVVTLNEIDFDYPQFDSSGIRVCLLFQNN